ncbi:PREDICTED: F-box/LRR-repeat MAX2 homolog A-like [Fragaria vesca subsp. vesca]|uniref:F-box/LRR-repeat MAX2 homolog A-like n=1 Tax=Fragaria vesca subsp. vesca TaxID=101020 RepID=UPI0002C371EA|nr:PREDICTED: F-box/LRR-repeat MAX2 homolog A-like [Fragaria vesca subsp. vesca]
MTAAALINDLPEAILTTIIALLSDTRTRNSVAHRLCLAFPSVTSLTVYFRSSSTVEIVFSLWPRLRRLKLVRWHQRPQSNLGADFDPLFQQCYALSDLDLSEFYYWTEDLPPVLEAHPNVARSLTKLNLLTASFTEGFKATEIRSITVAWS